MLTKVIEQSKIDHFTKWFDRADKIVIVSHVGPRRGRHRLFSGLVALLQLAGKSGECYCAERFPRFLKWMPGSKDYPSVRPLQGVCRQADCRGGCHLLSGF